MTEAMPFLQKYDITFLRPPTIQGRLFIQALLKSEAILPHTPTKTAHFRQTHRKRAVSYLSDERMIQSNASISMQRPATS